MSSSLALLIAVCVVGVSLYASGARAAESAAPQAKASGGGGQEILTYLGTYTNRGPSKGIYVTRLDLNTGKLSEPKLAAELTNPSFLTIHPSQRFLVAVGEVEQIGDAKGGGVTSFAINPDGSLKQLSQQSSGGTGSCHVTIDRTGRAVVVANYSGGSVASLPISADGTLGKAASVIKHEGKGTDPKRQDMPHVHSVNIDPSNRLAMVADLGLDKLMIYRLDTESAKLTPHDPPSVSVAARSGPRHFAFSPSGKHAYLLNELASTLTAFNYDAQKGLLTEIQTIGTLPPDYTEGGKNTTAEVVVHPSGKFLYASNRGHDSIAVFAIDPTSGKLRAMGHTPSGGKTPRNFNVEPSGRFLVAANQGSGNVVSFRIDPEKGTLTPTGSVIEVGAPCCVRFLAAPAEKK